MLNQSLAGLMTVDVSMADLFDDAQDARKLVAAQLRAAFAEASNGTWQLRVAIPITLMGTSEVRTWASMQ